MRESEEPGLEPEDAADLDRLLEALGGQIADGALGDRPGRRIGRVGGAVAALAAAAAFLYLGVPQRSGGPSASPDSVTDVGWDVSAEQSFAVFPTTDDDMVIIWILGDEQ